VTSLAEPLVSLRHRATLDRTHAELLAYVPEPDRATVTVLLRAFEAEVSVAVLDGAVRQVQGFNARRDREDFTRE